jgi:murein DD-endopeptidase MepM/ murein hydrolase activator NlpD
LSLASLDGKHVGDKVKSDEHIARLGTAEVNGDYPPHLHFQIIKDIQNFTGDYPGVCNRLNLEFYRDNCPDPNLLLGLN